MRTRHCTHTTPFLTRSPVELIDRSGANHLLDEYKALILTAKVQLGRGPVNDWWISVEASRLSTA